MRRWVFRGVVLALIGLWPLSHRSASSPPDLSTPISESRHVHITVQAFVDTNCNAVLDSADEQARDCSLYLHFALMSSSGCLIPNENQQGNPQSTIYSINGRAWAEFDVTVPPTVDTLFLELLSAEGGRYPYILCPNSPARRQVNLPPGNASLEALVYGIRRYVESRDEGTPIPTATLPYSPGDLTPTPTPSATATATVTLTPTPTSTLTPPPTATPTSTGTATPPPTPMPTATVSRTPPPPQTRAYFPLTVRMSRLRLTPRSAGLDERILNPGWSSRPMSFPCQPTPTPRPSPTPYQCFP